MTRFVYLYDHPARFIAGTVGMPGERTFFLQARDGVRITSVALEKSQVALLAERLEHLLDEISTEQGVDANFLGPVDLAPLDNPIEEEFRVGTLALGWNGNNDSVVIEAHALTELPMEVADLEEDSDDGPDVLRVRISASDARGFARRALSVVAAGRPPCPLCDQPLDAQGHICPRANGFRRRG